MRDLVRSAELFIVFNPGLGWHDEDARSMDAEIDGQPGRIVTPSLFICNDRLQLDRVGIDPSILEQVGHGWLCGIVSAPLNTLAKLRLACARPWDGSAHPGDRRLQPQSFTVANRHAPRLRVALDGEIRWMSLPLPIEVAREALRLILPGPQAGAKADTVDA